MTDAIGNITIGTGPGTFPQFGFVPSGGVLRQRENIDLITAPGCEMSAEWEIAPGFRAHASWLFTHPTIERAADRRLEGKLLAQTPENVFVGGIDWQPVTRCTATAQFRYTDRQFDDDQNTRVLAAYTTIDAAIGYAFSHEASAQLRVENLLNERIETGRSATGILSIGAPRLFSVQFRYKL